MVREFLVETAKDTYEMVKAICLSLIIYVITLKIAGVEIVVNNKVSVETLISAAVLSACVFKVMSDK